MTRQLKAVLGDAELASSLAASGLQTIKARHTCHHRVDELLTILSQHGTARVTEALAAKEAAQ
jgi:spore maturation protein CgeB